MFGIPIRDAKENRRDTLGEPLAPESPAKLRNSNQGRIFSKLHSGLRRSQLSCLCPAVEQQLPYAGNFYSPLYGNQGRPPPQCHFWLSLDSTEIIPPARMEIIVLCSSWTTSDGFQDHEESLKAWLLSPSWGVFPNPNVKHPTRCFAFTRLNYQMRCNS